MKPSYYISLLIFLLLFPALSGADAGVIIPLNRGGEAPDEKVLSIYRMELDILIDNGYATIKILQVFRNHTGRDIEGQFVFVIPSDSTISDFAVWDNQVRIPGVVLEKRRARQIYEEIVSTMRDPGLLETTDDTAMLHRFRARIFPIPAGGTKRLEMEYTQKLDISNLRSYFTFPLKPSLFKPQRVEVFKTSLRIKSNHNLTGFKLYPSNLNLAAKKQSKREIAIGGTARGVLLDSNISIEYFSDVKGVNFDFLTHRNAQRLIYDPDPYHGYKYRDKKGYFYSAVTYNIPPSTDIHKNKDVIILLDVSLSMQWRRLEQAYTALEYFIKKLKSGDRLQVILFNDDVRVWKKGLLPYSPARAENALRFVRDSYLTGGTDLLGAVKAGLKQVKDNPHVNEPYIVLITDGNPTLNELRYKKIKTEIDKFNSESASGIEERDYLAHIYIYGIGDKTNVTLLKKLTEENDGFFTWVSDTENQEFKLRSFLEKIGSDLISGISLIFDGASIVSMVYPEKEAKAFNKTTIGFVGTYKTPQNNIDLTVTGKRGGMDISKSHKVDLPETNLEHSHLPRMWARARVDKLLDLLNYEGEKREWINEVIALAKQYKFITPYTSFLAAPRSLLRPRVIKPGDPVLRIKTDPAIVSVVAQFPFGLIKPMRYIESEDIWEVRFLAPKEMNDGRYQCLLHLKDRDGNLYREGKTFIIDSKSPDILPVWTTRKYRAGDRIDLLVRADADTRRLMAKLGNGLPVELRYKTDQKASTGELDIPENTPSGLYKLALYAEDFAHNHTTLSLDIEIIGR